MEDKRDNTMEMGRSNSGNAVTRGGNNPEARGVREFAGSDDGSTAGGYKGRTISEAEAKMLLAEETRKTHQKLNEADKKNKKLLIIAIIVAVVVCAIGVGIAVVLGSKGDKGSTQDNTKEPGQSQVDTEKPKEDDEKPQGTEMMEVGLDDEEVRSLYDAFGILTTVDMIGIYSDPTAYSGFLNNKYLIGVAFGNVERKTCKMPKSDSELAKRYAEQIAQNIDSTEIAASYEFGCYDGEELRQKAQEIFGRAASLEGAEFPVLGWQYSEEYDEVYAVPGVGSDGFGPGKGYLRGLYKAEKDDKDNLYLYEVVAEMSGPGLICVKTGTYCEEEYDPTIENVAAHRDDFAQYKWYFTKQPDGKYVFSKLEKLN